MNLGKLSVEVNEEGSAWTSSEQMNVNDLNHIKRSQYHSDQVHNDLEEVIIHEDAYQSNMMNAEQSNIITADQEERNSRLEYKDNNVV